MNLLELIETDIILVEQLLDVNRGTVRVVILLDLLVHRIFRQ